MTTRKSNRKSNKTFRKTRSKRQRGGTNETPTRKQVHSAAKHKEIVHKLKNHQPVTKDEMDNYNKQKQYTTEYSNRHKVFVPKSNDATHFGDYRHIPRDAMRKDDAMRTIKDNLEYKIKNTLGEYVPIESLLRVPGLAKDYSVNHNVKRSQELYDEWRANEADKLKKQREQKRNEQNYKAQPIPKHILIPPSSSQPQPIQQQSHNNDAEVNMDINLPAVVDKQAEDKRVRQDIEEHMQREIAGYVEQMSHTPLGEVPSLMQPYMNEEQRQKYLGLTRVQQRRHHNEYSTHISNLNAKNLYNTVANRALPRIGRLMNDEQKQYYLQMTPNEQLIYLHTVAANDSANTASNIATASVDTSAEALIDMANMANMTNVITNVSDAPSIDMDTGSIASDDTLIDSLMDESSIASDGTLIDSPHLSPHLSPSPLPIPPLSPLPSYFPSPVPSPPPSIRRSNMQYNPSCSLKDCGGGKIKTRKNKRK